MDSIIFKNLKANQTARLIFVVSASVVDMETTDEKTGEVGSVKGTKIMYMIDGADGAFIVMDAWIQPQKVEGSKHENIRNIAPGVYEALFEEKAKNIMERGKKKQILQNAMVDLSEKVGDLPFGSVAGYKVSKPTGKNPAQP